VWYRFTAQPSATSATITLAGSSFDTLLAVYTGASVSALSLVASNDDCPGSNTFSCVTFNVLGGTTYSVQVDGWNGLKGSVSIALTVVVPSSPPNDAFSAAVTTFPATGTTVGATLETGEPLAGTGASGSVWYRFTTQAGATSATVTLAGSSYDTLLAVYTGASVSALSLVASNDDCPGSSTTSCVTFNVAGGTTYSVQVDGWNGLKGSVSIALTVVVPPTPANDAFSAAVTTFPATGTTLGATLETGEPQAVAGKGASGSVWYRFTAPANGIVQVTLNGSSYDTLLAAYTGTAVNALTLVANNDDCPTGGSPASCVTFSITQGTVYSLQVDGFGGRKGSVRIAVTVTVAGDPVASPIPVPLAGLGSQSLTATTVGATRQVGEPQLFTGVGESASIWFSWTAPRAGVLRVNTQGSPFNTVLGVYRTSVTTGAPTFASLTLVTTNDNCTGVTTSCATVTVARGVRYLVKVDGAAGAKGAVTMSFNLATV